MLYISRWKATAILLTALFVCLFAVPNFFPEKVVASWPKWAQRHVVLGLDLQGGSHILLEVDANFVRKEKAEQLRDDVRRVLRDSKVGYTGLVARGLTVEVRIRDESDFQAALAKLRELSVPLGGILSATGQRSLARRNRTGNRCSVVPEQMFRRPRRWMERPGPRRCGGPTGTRRGRRARRARCRRGRWSCRVHS